MLRFKLYILLLRKLSKIASSDLVAKRNIHRGLSFSKSLAVKSTGFHLCCPRTSLQYITVPRTFWLISVCCCVRFCRGAVVVKHVRIPWLASSVRVGNAENRELTGAVLVCL